MDLIPPDRPGVGQVHDLRQFVKERVHAGDMPAVACTKWGMVRVTPQSELESVMTSP